MATKRTAGLDIKVLEDKEVLMHFGENPAIDIATGTFLKGWHSAGMEPNDSTWGENRPVTKNDTQLTGGQTASSFTAGAVTGSVNLIPGSPVVDYIEWPETASKSNVLMRKHSNKVAKAYVARVHKFQSGIVGIKVSREKAVLTIDQRDTANDPQARALAIAYDNGDDGYMFEEMFYKIGADGTVEQVDPKIFQTIADVETKLTDGEAFVPDASSDGLTAMNVATDSVESSVDGVDLNDITAAG